MRKIIQEIRQRYSEPTRFYHNLNHLDYLNAKLKQYSNHICSSKFKIVELAILFHDSIYNIWNLAGQNELESAELLMQYNDQLYEYWFEYDYIDDVYDMIIASAHHSEYRPELPKETKFFLDLDLLSLSESYDIFEYNNHQLYLENKPRFPNYDDFRCGSNSFLIKFLLRDKIYYSDCFDDREEIARKNIKKYTGLNQYG